MIRLLCKILCFFILPLFIPVYAQFSENMVQVSRLYNFWDATYEVINSNNTAFIACGFSGLQILDISDPANPTVIGFWDDNQGKALGLDYRDGIVFLADDTCGVSIIDVSDLEHPTLLSICPSRGHAWDALINGEYLYIADGESGVTIFDVSDFREPFEIGRYDTLGSAREINIIDNYAFVANDTEGLLVLDISEPDNPLMVSGLWLRGQTKGLFVDDNVAYLANGAEGLISLDISDPANPNQLDQVGLSFANEVNIYDGLALVAAHENLHLIDVSDPEDLRELSRIQTPGFARSVCLTGANACVADFWRGVALFNVENPDDPQEIGTFETDGYISALDLSGDFAYLADSKLGGIRIIDISNPEQPRECSIYDSPGSARNVKVVDNFAYLADGAEGIRIIDIENEDEPESLGNFEFNGVCKDITIREGIAYVTVQLNFTGGLLILDVSNPERPQQISYIETEGGLPYKVLIQDDFAYITVPHAGMYLIDISDPNNPEQVEVFNLHCNLKGFDLNLPLVFLADYRYGLRIASLLEREGNFGQEISTIRSPGKCKEIFHSGGYSFLADYWSGVRVINAQSPLEPAEVAFFDTPGHSDDLLVRDSLVFVADYTNFGIFEFETFFEMSIEPDTIRFENVQVGDSSQIRELTFDNTGTGSFTITSFEINGDCYDSDFRDSLVIPGNTERYLNIGFIPQESRLYRGSISIETNVEEYAQFAGQLLGNGVQRIARLSVDTLDFGNVIARQMVVRQISVFNDGDADLDVEFFRTMGHRFSIDFQGTITIASNEYQEFDITFYPLVEGIYLDTVLFSTNDFFNSQISAILIGSYSLGISDDELTNSVPLEYSLSQPYPNPFNSNLIFQFSIVKPGNVEIILRDLMGKEVNSIVNETRIPGRYSESLSADHLANGLYFMEMNCNDFHAVRKVYLIK